MKKIGLMFGSLITIATPIVAVVSCGDKTKKDEHKNSSNQIQTVNEKPAVQEVRNEIDPNSPLGQWKAEQEAVDADTQKSVKNEIVDLYSSANIEQVKHFTGTTPLDVVYPAGGKIMSVFQMLKQQLDKPGTGIDRLSKSFINNDLLFSNNLAETGWKQMKFMALVVEEMYHIYDSLLKGNEDVSYSPIKGTGEFQ